MTYNHKQIEAKWQKFWHDNETYKVEIDNSKPKYYVLDMFPYPSGAGLHVGHLVGYTATDIFSRHLRQKGFNVLHPMGWDSFGLPAEQYAIRTGTHPEITTKKNIDNFRRQLMAIGYSYDWSREIATSAPDYYKWTQWIFTKLFQKGLAYEAEMSVNFCPALGTVLANEEVDGGFSKEGGHPVEKRPLRQWVLKITAYADKLLEDLNLLDWPESLKKLQSNWIGRSEGAQVEFQVSGSENKIQVFTTRPDTLFGATYMVLSPEHPLVAKITIAENSEAVENYRAAAAQKTEIDRTDANKTKSGVFTGAYAINPVNEVKMPIWISDYVLMGYGTGAIMAVPAHDERDFEFAKTFQLPVIPVFDPKLDNHLELIPEKMSAADARVAVLKGELCWPHGGLCINSSNAELSLNGLDVDTAKEAMLQWLEKKQLGKRTVTYKLRDWLFSRQRYWGEPFPILHLADGSKRVLELDELPLCPPQMDDFKPSSDGQSPLARAVDWINIFDEKASQKACRESNVMPQWAGSCWYYLRFCDPQNSEEAWSEESQRYWLPVDLYVGGAEHAVLHLLYARFWHKVLYDLGYVSTREPFQRLCNQGMVTARSYQRANGSYVAPEEVEEREGKYFEKSSGMQLRSQIDKMSKSKLNGVTPDDVIEEFGADALRLYTMFLGPLEKEKVWNTDAVTGCWRFINRFYDMATSSKISEEDSLAADKLIHRLVDGVSKDLQELQFNTAIAKLMEFLNDFTKLPSYPQKAVKVAIQMFSPFAPHMAQELWQINAFNEDLQTLNLPEVNPELLEDDVITYVVQINGKLRGRFDLPKDQGQEVVMLAANKNEAILRHIEGKTINKIVFVPNKLINIVLGE